MNVFYSDIEAEVVAHLADTLTAIQVDVVPLPEFQAEFSRPFLNGRVTVVYKGSEFGDHRDVGMVVQDEKIQIEVVVVCKKLRGASGIHGITELVKRKLLGFSPTDCNKMRLIKNGYHDYDKESALWSYSMIFETNYRLVEAAEYDTGPLLQQAIFEISTGDTTVVDPGEIPEFVRISNTDATWIHDVPNGLTYQVPDTPVSVVDENSNEIGTGSVPSVTGGQISVTLPPSSVNAEVVNSASTVVASGVVSTGSPQIAIGDTPVSVVDQNNNPLGSDTVPSVDGGTIQVTLPPDSVTAEVVNSNNVVVATGTVTDAAPQLAIGDTPVTVKDTSGNTLGSGSVASVQGGDVVITPPSAPQRSTSRLLKTGVTTIYASGDDGSTQRGRLVNLTTLAENNPFGNTNRFTDVIGGQVFANTIVLDWSTFDENDTVLGYSNQWQTAATWDNGCINAQSANVGGFTGWAMWNDIEMFNVIDRSRPMGDPFLPPFVSPYSNLWTATPASLAPTAYAFGYAYSNFTYSFAYDKANALRYGIVRVFNLAELGL